MHASEYLGSLENLARFRVPRTLRVPRFFGNLERCRVSRSFGNRERLQHLGPMPRDPSYSELCSEALFESSTRTRRELFTQQIWKVGRSSRAGPIRTCDLESTAVKMVTQTEKQTEIPGPRRNICTVVPVRSAGYVITPPHTTPSRPAPCLHLTHPVFNPVSTHSLNASVARGDTKMRNCSSRISERREWRGLVKP